MKTTTLRAEAAAAPYDITIGAGLLKNTGRHLSSLLPSKKAVIVTDETVAKLYLEPVMHALQTAGFFLPAPVILPAGEATKSFAHFEQLTNDVLGRGIDRFSSLIALGGGVIGDITGFAASALLRGIPLVQIPTTLLAQVDSAVGGKTGINTAFGKNLIGSVYSPRAVLIDTDTLTTLPARHLRAGYAEILKYSLINNLVLFDWLEKNGGAFLDGNSPLQQQAIDMSCRAKTLIVRQDEKEEKDIRALLNLGHTFAHALEALGGYDDRLLHGEAVGIGLCLAAKFSARLNLCTSADAQKIEGHLRERGMMTCPPFRVTSAQMLEKMRKDKKSCDNKIRLVLLKAIGHAFVEKNVDETALKDFLDQTI